jgi:hypothetical protein
MGYCTETDIKMTIAQALTSANAELTDDFGTYSDLLNIGNSFDKNLVTSDTINYYIQLADSEIDATLSQLYKTPFCEKCDFETTLYSSVNEYNPYILIESYCPLAAGDNIILVDGDHQERHIVDTVINGTTFSTISEIQYFFPEDSRILRVSYPPPVRFISARLASANIYDKYFSSESSPNTSEFGKQIRELASTRLNDILNGIIILHGQMRVGRRFYNPNLVEQYNLPLGGDMSKGQK